jgi:hypothetical protein
MSVLSFLPHQNPVYISLNASKNVSNPHKKTGKIIILYIVVFPFFL